MKREQIKMIDKKQMILNTLKRERKLSTTKIAFYIKASHPRALELLEELKKEKSIKQNREMMGISWSLK
jgi:hypothetical protein